MFNKKYASKLNLQSVNDLLNYKNPTKMKTKGKTKRKTKRKTKTLRKKHLFPKYNTRKQRHSKFKHVKIPKIKKLMKTRMKMKKKMKRKTLKRKS
jgi:hypothetical protein